MNTLLVFISLFLGIKFGLSFDPIYLGVLLLLFLFGYWRFGKRKLLIIFLFSILGIIISVIKIQYLEKEKFQGIIIDCKDNYFLFQYRLQRFYVYAKGHTYEVGDVLELQGKPWGIQIPKLESQFDFQKYLHDRGVDWQLSNYNAKVLLNFPIRRRAIISNFLKGFDSNTSDIFRALLFGTRNYDGEVIASFQNAGLIQVIGLSGVHISTLLRVQKKIISYLINDKTSKGISIFLVFLLVNIVPNSVPLWRLILNEISPNNAQTNTSVSRSKIEQKCLIGTLMLIFSIYLVNSWSFIIGISLSLFFILFRTAKIKTGIIFNYFRFNFLVFLLLLPYIANTQMEIHFLSWVFSGLLFLFLSIFFGFGWFQFFFLPFPILSKSLTSGLLTFINFLDGFDISVFANFDFPLLIIGYFFFIFFWIYFKDKGFNNFSNMSIFSVFVIITFVTFPINNSFSTEVYFINVGQGDAILIREGSKCILIDTGGNISFDVAQNVLIPFFKKERIYAIEKVIITHNDYDHNGALATLISNFNIGEIITSRNRFPLTFESILIKNLNNFTGNADNENSLVLEFDFIGKKWLLMGDVPLVVENYLMESFPRLNIDYLKVGHHGSDSSTSYRFLKKISPIEAIISVGRNSYGHPSNEVITRLEKLNIKVRRTDLEGTIAYQQWSW